MIRAINSYIKETKMLLQEITQISDYFKLFISQDGTWEWKFKGKYHREDGPAYYNIETGVEYWYQHGNLHREDGPAIILPNGYKAWWEKGVLIREEKPKKTDLH
jgi:hypothetical protein